jgi:hypothetical protein
MDPDSDPDPTADKDPGIFVIDLQDDDKKIFFLLPVLFYIIFQR